MDDELWTVWITLKEQISHHLVPKKKKLPMSVFIFVTEILLQIFMEFSDLLLLGLVYKSEVGGFL